MKNLLFVLAMFAANLVSASDCGYGNLYRDLECHVSLSATYEAGYTETYAKAELRLNHAFEKAKFQLEDLGGSITRRVDADGTHLDLVFDRPVDGIGASASKTVTFPETCNGEQAVWSLYGNTITEQAGGYSSPRDVNVFCKAHVWFDKD